MNQNDIVENWLSLVSYSHSQSKATEEQYKRVWQEFTSFIEKSAEQILEDYRVSEERIFRMQYTQYIKAWIAHLSKRNLTNTSIAVMVGAVKSFFKYNDLPLGHVPQTMNGVIYHNKDITKEEITQIMAICKIREQAFFAVMAQSGLRPHTIKQLKLGHLESLDKTPCKIEVPKEIAKGKFGNFVTFIGSDALKYLKQYLATRVNLTSKSLLFCAHDDPAKPINTKDVSGIFRRAARTLEETGAIKFEVRENKPSELRLYNLRKFFRKQAYQMGFENVNYLMGHVVRGSDANYRPQDPEFYRELYAEKAMPFLRLETATPTETEKTIAELRKQIGQRDQKLQEIENKLTKIEPLLDFVSDYPNLETLLKDLAEGRYAKVESERSLMMQIPKRVIEKLWEQAKAKGEDRIGFTLDQLKKMSIEDSEAARKKRDKEN